MLVNDVDKIKVILLIQSLGRKWVGQPEMIELRRLRNKYKIKDISVNELRDDLLKLKKLS